MTMTMMMTSLGLECNSECSLLYMYYTGEAGVGKTQLALQALLQVQLSKSDGGLEGSGLLIYTEGGNIPLGRMEGIANVSYKNLESPTDKVAIYLFAREYQKP